eukprot:scaffold233764_cov17-Prasinocladus_malaysianus.AAC.1
MMVALAVPLSRHDHGGVEWGGRDISIVLRIGTAHQGVASTEKVPYPATWDLGTTLHVVGNGVPYHCPVSSEHQAEENVMQFQPPSQNMWLTSMRRPESRPPFISQRPESTSQVIYSAVIPESKARLKRCLRNYGFLNVQLDVTNTKIVCPKCLRRYPAHINALT